VWPGKGEDLCWLAGDWRILQRIDGHRWSIDDLVTAWHATRVATPSHAVDLGCGIGAVLLLLAWRFPEARITGIEAQEISAGLARRSIAFNGVDDRCEIRCGDFRDPASRGGLEGADLVTGTPPYFPRGTGTESGRPQCGPCRFEHRGGIEDYVAGAAPLLAAGGVFVACAPARDRERVLAAADAGALAVETWRDVVPRAGKPPLVAVFSMRRRESARPMCEDPPLVVRGADGRRTAEFHAVRESMGTPTLDDLRTTRGSLPAAGK
jgi:tRNA1Val (adenine37-N6)-methyltransferase